MQTIGIRNILSNSTWTPFNIISKILFWGEISEIAAGRMPNKVTGSTDYLTVGGTAGSYTFQCPNTAPYQTADTDYIWFKTDVTQRTATEAELVGYDLQATPTKYDDASPNLLREIVILATPFNSLSTAEQNHLFAYLYLPIEWHNDTNAYGHIKSNRTGQNLFPVETFVVVISSATIEDAAKADVVITFAEALDETSIPDVTDFILAGKTITNVDISGAVVTLTVSVAYANGDVVTASYVKPAANYLLTLTNKRISSFTDQAVTNNIALPYTLYDTFTDTDDVALTAHMMDVGAGWTADVDFKISGNKLVNLNPTAVTKAIYAIAESGKSDVDITLDITMSTLVANIYTGILFRYQDATHFWVLVLACDNGVTNEIRLYKDFLTLTGSAVSIVRQNGVTYTLRVVASGNSIKCYWSDPATPGAIIDVTSAAYNDKTKQGIVGYVTASYSFFTVDNFKVI